MQYTFIAVLAAFLAISCAKVEYIAKQGLGQASLLSRARPNAELLKSPEIKEEDKRKIRLVETYKEWFYAYWPRTSTNIYGKTTILKDEAVTYLVVRSPKEEVRALEECFIFAGCFPYLGFFDRGDAEKFAQERQKEGEVTWMRPVYAYSTLNHFTDPILSSFFYYDDVELAELVFHELFHTIYFVKDNVDLNEALASYFASQMAQEYFKDKGDAPNRRLTALKGLENLDKVVMESGLELDRRYKAECPCDDPKRQGILKSVLENKFFPAMRQACKAAKGPEYECRPLLREWNNAAFAAFLTYEERAFDIQALHVRVGGGPREFLAYLESKWEEYKKLRPKEQEFADWLLGPSK